MRPEPRSARTTVGANDAERRRCGCVVVSANTSWNIVNFRASLIRALQCHGYAVVVMSPPDRFTDRIAALGCSYVALPMDNKGTSPLRDGLLMLRYWRELRRLKPAAFIGFTIKPNIYGSLAAHWLGVPTINNISGLGTAFIRDTWLTRLVKILYRLALGRAHQVFFQNADDRALFVRERLVDERRSAVIPGSGIDLDYFSPRDETAAERPAPVAFLLLARLLWDKGIGEYVEATRIVRRTHPEARFRLAGMLDVENRTAVDAATVEGWVKEGAVEYLGALDDVRAALAAADCVVLPSYREGAPRTLLEAAAMARPVIATDVPGCRAVVEPGTTGLLCRVRDAHDLAAAMIRMLEMGREARAAMGRAGRAMVERRFDERLVIRAYREALDAVRTRPV